LRLAEHAVFRLTDSSSVTRSVANYMLGLSRGVNPLVSTVPRHT